MTLIEQESTNIFDHIRYWDSVRQENLLAYYAKSEGYTHLGLQPLPALVVSEYKCKEAMKIKLLLISLSKSSYAHEPWTLSDVSAELINTDPKNCFKKKPFTVTVYFDNNKDNSYPYMCWDYIYYQDEHSKWHKVAGEVDVNGIFFRDIAGDISYFTLFQPDAERYGRTGHWTVKYKHETLFTSIASSTSRAAFEPETREQRPSSHPVPSPKRPRKRKQETDEDTSRESPTSTNTGLRLRRRRVEQGESSTDRPTTTRSTPRRRRSANGVAVTPEEVGSGTRSVPREGLSRIQRLQEEARDPELIVFQGGANTLKCFRNKCAGRYADLYTAATTVFYWVNSDKDKTPMGRMLMAFDTQTQRDLFIASVTIPKGCQYCFGNIDCL